MIALDGQRRALKESLYKLMIKEGGIPDIVKKTLHLLEGYPELSSLKERIKYPDQLDSAALTQLTQELDSTIHKIGHELLALSSFYKNNTALSVRVSSDLIEPYLVTQKVALKLLSRNKYGDIIKVNTRGNHPVISIEGLHLKGENEPLDSGMEMSVYLLHSLLLGEEIGPSLAPTCLLTVDNVQIEELLQPLSGDDVNRFEEAENNHQRGVFFITHPEIKCESVPRSFLLQAAATVEGKSLEEHLDNLPLFDEENFSALILSSFLTIPTDYKPDNFIVTFEKGKLVAKIIGIDNDMAFVYPLTIYGKKQEHVVALKNALYFFEKMMDKPIAPKVRERIRKLDPVLLGIEWAAAVFEQAQKYDQLGVKGKFFPLRFTKNTLHQLIETLQTLKKINADYNLRSVTHRQLFRLLFPVVEHFYERFSKQSTKEKVEKLFFSPGSVESCLSGKEKLEDGRTVKEALDAADKEVFAFQEERDTAIETLCYELLKSLDLKTFPLEKQCAILTLAARHFPNIDHPHPSWTESALPFHLIHFSHDLSALPFLQKLGIDLRGQNREGDTILHVLIKQGKELPSQLLPQIPFEALNQKKLTPLELAMEREMVETVIALIHAGAGSIASSTRAWEFYRFVQKKNHPPLTEAFQTLIQRNSRLEWKMARETIFPAGGSGAAVFSPLFGQKTLHPTAFEQLWKGGTFQRINVFGRREVGKASLEDFTLFLKRKPAIPGADQAVATLIHQVMGFGAPHSDLVKIEGVPYLVTQGIKGLTLHEVLTTAPDLLQKLNKKRFSQLILLTMLINPEDGKPDNYIYNPMPDAKGEYQIVSIDNDHSFVPSVATQSFFGMKKKCVQVKTILYCLDQMHDPIDPAVKKQFLLHNPAEIMTEWFSHLSSLQELYLEAFSPEERQELFEKHGTYIGIPFREEMITALYRKFVKIQFILDLEKNNPHFSHFDLLMKIDRPVGLRYFEGLKKKVPPLQRFLAIDGKDYEIKNDLILSTTQAKEILVSYNIVTQTDMAQLIAKGAAFDPEKALQKLKEVIKQDRLLIIEQEKVDFSTLDEPKISELLKRTPFSKIALPVEQSILRQIHKIAWKELSLISAATLGNDYLKRLDFTHVVSLNLSYCQQLTDQVVEQIVSAAPQLEKLDLSGIESFKQIHGGMGFFSEKILETNRITHLFLNHNPNLVSVKIKGKQLVVVECEGARLSRLEIDCPGLSQLNIKNNKYLTNKNLDELIHHSLNIKRLNLEGCDKIDNKELRYQYPLIPFSWIELTTIKDLLENKITEFNHNCGSSIYGLKALSNALSINRSLNTLELSGGNYHQGKYEDNYIWDYIDFFFQTLAEHPTITSLNLKSFRMTELSYERTSPVGAASREVIKSRFDWKLGTLAKGLKKNNRLKSLTITGCRVSGGIIALSEYLESSPSLTTLDLSSCSIEYLKCLADALKQNKILKTLNLSRNSMKDLENQIEYLAEALISNYTLASLDLSFCDIGMDGAIALAKTMKINPTLRSLNLKSNPVGAEGAKEIASALMHHPLTSLNLGGIQICKLMGMLNVLMNSFYKDERELEGIIALAEVLKSQNFLTSLDLSNNNIGQKGAEIIAEALKTNKSLVSLNLSDNNIGVAGGVAIAEALKFNKSLVSLNLSNTNIGVLEAIDIENALKANMPPKSDAEPPALDKHVVDDSVKSEAAADPPSLPFTPFPLTPPTAETFFIQGKVHEQKDLPAALPLYLEAALMGHKEALQKLYHLNAHFPLGCYYEQKKEMADASYHFAVATAEGDLDGKEGLNRLASSDPYAKSLLAILLQKGIGMKKEIAKAILLHQAAVDEGVEVSKLHLGLLYYMGFATDADQKKAIPLIDSADLAGYPEAALVKEAILKELRAKEKIIQSAANFDQGLYQLVNLMELSKDKLLNLIPLSKQGAASSLSPPKPAYAVQKEEILKRIQELEVQKATAQNLEQSILIKQIEQLNTALQEAEELTGKHELLLNQKKKLVHNAFKTKIAQIFAAVDAIVSDQALPKSTYTDDAVHVSLLKGAQIASKLALATAKTIPFAGTMIDISQFVIEKILEKERIERVKEKCRRIQAYYPEPGGAGIEALSSALASGFVFRFQELIHQLDAKSQDRFTEHYIMIFTNYLFEKAPDDATTFELLMGGALEKASPLNRFLAKKLKTERGLEWTIEDLYFASGLRTIYGGIYHPKGSKSPAFYRLGTKEEVEILESKGIEMEQVEEERKDHLVAKVDRKLAAARYLQEAEILAKEYMNVSS